MDILSESASFDELKDFSWYIYNAKKVFELKTPRNTNTMAQGSIFGVRPIRGNRYYVVLKDYYHVNFTIESEEYARLMKSSDEIKMPKMTDIRAAGKAPRMSQGNESRKWDSDKFKAARKIKAEKTYGIDFANYQWRKIVRDEGFSLTKTLKLKRNLKAGDVFGVRWIAPTKGGMYIDTTGRSIVIKERYWDMMLEASKVLPKDKWPEGKLSPEEIKKSLRAEYREERAKEIEERRKILQLKKADKEREQELARLAAAEKRKRIREQAEALKQSAKQNSIAEKIAKAKKAQQMRETTDERVRDILRSDRLKKEKVLKDKLPEIDDFDDDSLADDLDFDNEDSGQGYEHVGIEDFDPESDSLSRDASDPVELLDGAVDELRQKQRKVSIKEVADDEPDEEVPEDELDYDDEDQEDTDDGEESDEEDDSAEDEEPDDSEDPEESADDEESDDSEVDDTEEDSDGEEEPDEEPEEDSEDDSEEEEPEEKYEKAEEGHVVTFHSDESEQREFIITSIYPFPKNNNILVYRLYDLTNEPEEWRTVRVDTTKSASFEKSVDFIRVAKPAELKEARKLVERYEKNNDPIVS